MNPCIFVSVCNMFLFSFSFRVKLNIAADTRAVFFWSVQYCQKVFVTTCVKRKKKLGFRVFTSPFNRILVAQKLFRTEALSPSGFEMDRSLKLWMIRPLPCWRQHLTLHMKTVLFHCLCVTYTFHSIMKCNKNIFAPQRLIFSSVLLSLSGQAERWREREGDLGRGSPGGGGEKRGHVWECDRAVLANKSSRLHHSLSPRRSFVLKLLSLLLFLSLRPSPLSSLLS